MDSLLQKSFQNQRSTLNMKKIKQETEKRENEEGNQIVMRKKKEKKLTFTFLKKESLTHQASLFSGCGK